MAVKYIPDGYQHVIPYLAVPDAGKIIPFAEKVLGAEAFVRMDGPNGKLMHAEMRIKDTVVMIGEPQDGSKQTAMLVVYLPDVDAAYRRALDAGGKSVREPSNQFYGDRTALVEDACGNQWYLSTHVEDVSPEEMQQRMAKAGQGGAA